MKLTLSLIRRALGPTAFQRGLAYHTAGKVLEFDAQPNGSTCRLTASTTGSQGEIYRQDVKLVQKAEDVDIDGHCTCPVLYNCKHVAAACCAWAASQLPGARTAAPAPPAIVRWLGQVAQAGAPEPTIEDGDEYLVYLLDAVTHGRGLDARELLRLEPRVVKRSAKGGRISRGRAVDLDTFGIGYGMASRVTTALDREIATLLSGLNVYHSAYALRGRAAYHALQLILDSGRAHWASPGEPPLTRGPARRLLLRWVPVSATLLALEAEVDEGGRLIPSEPPLYVDPDCHCIGELDTGGLSGAQLALLESAPPVPTADAERVAAALVSNFRRVPIPPPVAVAIRDNRGHAPRPLLSLRGSRERERVHAWALLDVAYDEDALPADPGLTSTTLKTGEGYVTIARDVAGETALHERLRGFGFERAGRSPDPARPDATAYVAHGDDEAEDALRWSALLRARPELEAAGWRFAIAEDFPLRFETADWLAEIDEGSGIDWFELSFHFQIGEERIPLLDAIAPVLGMDWTKLPEIVVVPIGAQRYVEIPAARLRPLLDTLAALFDRERHGAAARLSRFDAPLLEELAAQGLAIGGGQRWRELAERLRDFTGLAPVAPDPDLRAELRPYQLKGLAWLQFLREYGFNGVLADDMGLGKTLQTLAHLLSEKRAGRLDVPALVVAPTSLMGNWRREAERFAPALAVQVLHGPQRHSLFEAASRADLVLTTYALLPRDEAQLRRMEFHSVILDEAQNVKNPRAKAAQVVRLLDARHRLCLTGTPLENHLGELWALFDFLMPGFLGDAESFRRQYRTPIETHRDLARQQALARRIAPFMLRRSKQAVASELPPKTEIVQRIEFSPAQAERYESVRVTVDRRVREAIEQQGFARSQITILDALLKLRQVCCDPRLLDPQAASHAPSAKLERLLELLEELHEEGRRVLVFSQFTSMLALIEQALKARGSAYVKLTGKTKRRDEAIDAFRRGEVDVFLISLKAGGVGLNLPEADTVIHYDPWWNPAVEAQATDRAHRIGQTQPVFVYKLIIDGSVEEKMLELQARKQMLAQGLYAEGGVDDGPLLDDTSLAALFEPLS
ncbi:MAG TPA: DEAD/DEAH box helicase [Gammaproteobacteria bacterium]|nr:DEAD/DEAH box helicase [Gammaproteobacteria bacterium]